MKHWNKRKYKEKTLALMIVLALVLSLFPGLDGGVLAMETAAVEAGGVLAMETAAVETGGVLAMGTAVVEAGSAIVAYDAAGAERTVDIPVDITANPGLCSYVLEIGYDNAALTLNSITQGTVNLGNWMINIAAGPGKANVASIGSINNNGAGSLFTLNFTVADGAAGAYPVTVGVARGDAENFCNEAAEAVPVTFIPGRITVIAPPAAETPAFNLNLSPVPVIYAVGDTAAALTVTAGVSDGGTVSYQWYSNTENNTTGGIEISGATTGSYTPAADSPGTTYYYVIATNTLDGSASSATSNTAAVTVTERAGSNRAPALKSGVPAAVCAAVRINTAYTQNLGDIFEDADGDPLTYWVKVDGADPVAADAGYTYTPAAAGTTTLVFTASDGAAESESYTVTLTVTALSALTFKVAPASSQVAFYATAGFDSEGYDFYDPDSPLFAADGGVDESGYHVYTVQAPDTVSDISFRGADASGNALGGMAVHLDDAMDGVITLRQVELYVSTQIGGAYPQEDQARFIVKDAGGMTAICGSVYVDAGGKTRFRYLLYAGGNAELYTYYAAPQGALADTYATGVGQYKTVFSGTSTLVVPMSLPLNYTYTVTAPTGASVRIFDQLRNFHAAEIKETGGTDNGDGTTSHVFRLPGGNDSLTYRVSMDGNITKAGYLPSLSGNGGLTVNWTGTDASPATGENNVQSAELGTYLEESLLLNVNSRNCLKLDPGETFRLRAYRIWQIINTVTANIMIEPDFHYKVISGKEAVSINAVTEGNGNASGNWLDITAVNEGVALVEVTYDAIDISGSKFANGVYAASDPRRAGLLVIQVGGSDTDGIGLGIGSWDAEYDTLYFNGPSGAFKLSPSVSGGSVGSVAVLNNPSANSEWTGLTAADGVYTAAITPGNNILRVTAGDAAEYQIVRGAPVTTVVENVTCPGRPVQAEDTVKVSFEGLYIPIPKFSAVYIPGSGEGHSITYTLEPGSALVSQERAQYSFINNHALEVTFAEEGSYYMTGGHITFSLMGAADPLDGHRLLTDTGAGANFNTVSTTHARSILPDVEISVDAKVYDVESCLAGLRKLISTAQSALGSITVSADGKNVATDKYWVKLAEYTAFSAAIEAARAMTENNSVEELILAKSTLQAALDAFNSAKAYGTRNSSSGGTTDTSNLVFDISGSRVKGYVTVSFEDYGMRTDPESDYSRGLGIVIPAVKVPYASGDSIAAVTIRLLKALGIGYSHWGTIEGGFYLQLIKEFTLKDGTYAEILGEFTNGNGSGWMITWNNWFINLGASEFQVEDGDIIKWQYTCQLGADIGCNWNNPSAEITGLTFKQNYGVLTPAFSKDVTDYIYTVSPSVKSICLEARQENYWAVLTYKSGGKNYKPMASIPVSNGTVIRLDCAFSEFYGDPPTDTDYLTITIQVKGAPKVTPGGTNNNTLVPKATVTNREAAVAISASDIAAAIAAVRENSSADIVIVPEITGEVRKVTIELPKSSFSSMASETDANLTVETPVGHMTIPNKALDFITTQAMGDIVTISLEQVDTAAALTPAQQETVGDNQVYGISVLSGGQAISVFDGARLAISLPYTLLEGEFPEGVAVWYLNDTGGLEELACAYDTETGLASFVAGRLPYYAVGYGQETVVPAPLVPWINPFSDVKKGDWFYDSVAFVMQNGLFSGTGDSAFSPNVPMTRAMLVTVLHRLAGTPAVAAANSFSDVREGQWYTDAILWAAGCGVAEGCGSGLFGPNDPITREQTAAILYRYAVRSGGGVFVAGDLGRFKDAGGVSDWAADSVRWAVGRGLLRGKDDGVLDPQGAATRAEVAAVLQNFMENFAK